jgi:hypothetical protein
LAGGWGAIVRHHQHGARIFLGRLLVLRQRRRGAPALRGMAGIDLARIRHKAGIGRRRWIFGLRGCDEYYGGCCQCGRRDGERVAFHANLLWLVPEQRPKA